MLPNIDGLKVGLSISWQRWLGWPLPLGMVGLLIAGMASMFASMGIGRFASTPFQPALRAGLGFSFSEVGFIATANYIGYLLGAIITSHKKFPLKGHNLLMLGLLMNILALGLIGLSQDWLFYLALLRFFAGIASAFAMLAVTSLVVGYLQHWHKESWLGWHFAGIGVGMILSAWLAEIFTLAGWGWRGLWFGAMAMALIANLAAYWGLRGLSPLALPTQDKGIAGQGMGGEQASPKPDQASIIQEDNILRRDGKFLLYGYGFFALGYVITATFLADQIKSNPATAHYANYGWMATGIGTLFSTALLVRLVSKLGYPFTMGLGGLMTGLAVILTIVSPKIWVILLAAFLFGLFFTGVVALGLRSAQKIAAARNRLTLQKFEKPLHQQQDMGQQAMAALTIAFGLGQMAGPWLAGIMVDATGSFALVSLAAGLSLALSGLAMGWGCRHVH